MSPFSRTPFTQRVLAVVRRIPRGQVATYGDVAALAGHPTSWRAVGNVLRRCRNPAVPCHRVVASEGSLGGYGDLVIKQRLLEAEGVYVAGQRLRNFRHVHWQPSHERATIATLEDI